MNDALLVERSDSGVVVLTLNRPDVRNVISDEPMLSLLTQECLDLADDDSVRAVILTGNGSAFSAGGNLDQMIAKSGYLGGTTAEIADGYRRGIQRLTMAVFSLPMPTIAALNGHAIGAGLDLALACDLRLASRTARVGSTFVSVGLAPGDGGAWLLPRAVGQQKAAEMALTARLMDAQECLDAGLVLSVHEPDDLMAQAHELAARIVANSNVAVRYTKRLLQGSRASFQDHLDEVSNLQAILHGTKEHDEAVAKLVQSIRDRRKPTK